jgi:hypothetical protein
MKRRGFLAVLAAAVGAIVGRKPLGDDYLFDGKVWVPSEDEMVRLGLIDVPGGHPLPPWEME